MVHHAIYIVWHTRARTEFSHFLIKKNFSYAQADRFSQL